MKKIILVIVVLVVAFLLWGSYSNSTPEGREKSKSREAITYCWSEQNKKSNSAEQAHVKRWKMIFVQNME